MKVHHILSAIVASSALAVIAFSQAEDPALRKEMQALYGSYDRMIEKGDMKAFIATLDPSFAAVDADGKRSTYSQVKRQYEELLKGTRDRKGHTSVKHVQRQGNEVSVWAETSFTFKFQQRGKWVSMKETMRFVDTLKKSGSGWKITYSQELPTNEPWSFSGK